MDPDTLVRNFSGILFVVGIVVVPVLYWFFTRAAAEQDPNKAPSENKREEGERQDEEHGATRGNGS